MICEVDSSISAKLGDGANGLKNAFGSKSGGGGTDCSGRSSAVLSLGDSVCSSVVGDSIGGASSTTEVDVEGVSGVGGVISG